MGVVYRGVCWDFVFYYFSIFLKSTIAWSQPAIDYYVQNYFYKDLQDGSKLTMDKSKNNLPYRFKFMLCFLEQITCFFIKKIVQIFNRQFLGRGKLDKRQGKGEGLDMYSFFNISTEMSSQAALKQYPSVFLFHTYEHVVLLV